LVVELLVTFVWTPMKMPETESLGVYKSKAVRERFENGWVNLLV
jgi:hypothetical protein